MFHAGTAMKDGKVTSAGGRARRDRPGKNITEAAKKSYAAVDVIEWPEAGSCAETMGTEQYTREKVTSSSLGTVYDHYI